MQESQPPDEPLSLGAVRRVSAIDAVRTRIVLAVRLGLLLPGDRLPVPESAATAMGVSAMSVRRAYRSLAEQAVLRRARGRAGGTFIADAPATIDPVTLAAYDDDRAHVGRLIDERAALETGLAAMAAARDDRHDRLSGLGELVDLMASTQDWADYRAADVAFHRGIAEAAAMPAAERLHRRVAGELYTYFLPYRMDELHASNDEHREILTALQSGDVRDAAARVHAHVVELHRSMYIGLPDPSSHTGTSP